MNLTTEETQVVILALREYREHWNTNEHQELFEEVNHLMRRFQLSLNQKVIREERIEKKMKAGEKEVRVDEDDEVTHTRVVGTKEWIPVKKMRTQTTINDHQRTLTDCG